MKCPKCNTTMYMSDFDAYTCPQCNHITNIDTHAEELEDWKNREQYGIMW